MRHQSQDVASFICHAGDISERTVRIRGHGHNAAFVDVAKRDLSGRFDARVRLGIGYPAALAVADRHSQYGAAQPARELRPVAFHAGAHPVGAVREIGVADEGAREETGLAENLKAVAASEDRPTLGREAAKLLRPGGEL